jgi:hypothetical protein
MFKTTIGLTLMFRVSSRDKAKKQLQRAQELLGHELRLSKCERYWKIPELWTCDTTTHFEVPSIAEQITGCLLLANRLATGWYVLGPHLRSDGTLETFGGTFDHRQSGANMQSLEWAEFQVLKSAASPSQ